MIMKIKYIICTFFFTSLMVSCGSTKTTVNSDDKLVGNWSLIAEATPQGDIPLTMTITKNEAGMFEGSFKSVMGDFDMLNLVLKDGVISCSFNVQGQIFEFRGIFTNGEFKGETLGPSENYVTNGNKNAE